jgi:hypothetical protein
LGTFSSKPLFSFPLSFGGGLPVGALGVAILETVVRGLLRRRSEMRLAMMAGDEGYGGMAGLRMTRVSPVTSSPHRKHFPLKLSVSL